MTLRLSLRLNNFLIVLLLVIRALQGWLSFIISSKNWYLLENLLKVSAFIVLVSLLIINRNNLQEYFIDKVAIIITLVFVPSQYIILPMLSSKDYQPWYGNLWFWVCAGGSAIAYCYLKPDFKNKNLPTKNSTNRSLLIGLFTGIALNLVYGFIQSYIQGQVNFPQIKLDNTILWSFPYQLGYSSAPEENLFRGFLLKRFTDFFPSQKIVPNICQAIFTLAVHGYIFSIKDNFLALLMVLNFGICMGYLTTHFRSISPGMIAHASYNAIGIFTIYIFQQVIKLPLLY